MEISKDTKEALNEIIRVYKKRVANCKEKQSESEGEDIRGYERSIKSFEETIKELRLIRDGASKKRWSVIPGMWVMFL